MEKTEQGPETSFTLSEYDQLYLDLDFIIASLQVATDHDTEVFDATPIFYEALNKAIASKERIEKIQFERNAA